MSLYCRAVYASTGAGVGVSAGGAAVGSACVVLVFVLWYLTYFTTLGKYSGGFGTQGGVERLWP